MNTAGSVNEFNLSRLKSKVVPRNKFIRELPNSQLVHKAVRWFAAESGVELNNSESYSEIYLSLFAKSIWVLRGAGVKSYQVVGTVGSFNTLRGLCSI